MLECGVLHTLPLTSLTSSLRSNQYQDRSPGRARKYFDGIRSNTNFNTPNSNLVRYVASPLAHTKHHILGQRPNNTKIVPLPPMSPKAFRLGIRFDTICKPRVRKPGSSLCSPTSPPSTRVNKAYH